MSCSPGHHHLEHTQKKKNCNIVPYLSNLLTLLQSLGTSWPVDRGCAQMQPTEVLCYRYITKYCSLEHSCYLVMHSAEYLCRLHRYAKGARGPRQWKSTLLEVNFLYKFWIFLRARKRTLRREGLARILMECSDRWHQHPNIISQLPKTLLGYNSRLCLFCCLSVTRPKA